MTIEERVNAELARLKPQLSRLEWFTLEDVLRASLTRVITELTPPTRVHRRAKLGDL